MHTQVKDIMTTEVITVEENTTFKDIVRLMQRQHVRAVPVLDPGGQVRGVISESDLLLKEADPDAAERRHLMPERRREQHKAEATIAAELMTSPAITVPASATVEDAARSMRRHKIGQLPVIDTQSGRMIGIVARADVLAIYRRPDPGIRRDVVEEVIAEEFGMDPGRFTVTVEDGRVTIEGTIERRSRIPLLAYAIRHVEGVVSAMIRLDYEVDDTYPDSYPYM